MAEDLVRDLQHMRGDREFAQFFLSEYDQRVTATADWHRRVSEVDQVARGELPFTDPEGRTIIERGSVPNLVELVMRDRPALASGIMPSVRCDPANERGKARAEKRERIASYYLEVNRVPLLMPYFFIDFITTGVSFKLVLPDFDTGYPCIHRIDPRHAYPDRLFRPDKPLTNLLVSSQVPLGNLLDDYPGAAGALASSRKRRHELVEVLDYYDSSECVKVAMWPSERGKREGTVLVRVTNRLARVPIAASVLPMWDGQFRGIFDNVLPALKKQNIIFNLMIDHAASTVGAQLVAEGEVHNPEDFGSGNIIRIEKGGRIYRAVPDQTPTTTFGVLERMIQGGREQAVWPPARSGTVEQSIISAAGINSLVGTLQTAVAQDQRIEAYSWAEALSLCFETDEKYLDETKYITGSANSKRFAESYKPSKDIAGDYRARVEYGGTQGANPFEADVRIAGAVDRKIVPLRVAREKSSFVEDVLETERLIEREAALEAGRAFVQTAAANGDPRPLSAWVQAIDKGEDPLMVIPQFGAIFAGGQQQAGTGLEAFSEFAGLARGGLPSGQPGASNIPGLAAAPTLPPLDQLRVG